MVRLCGVGGGSTKILGLTKVLSIGLGVLRTPYCNVNGEMRGSEGILSLTRISSSIFRSGVADPQLGRHSFQLPDFGGAGFPRHCQVVSVVFSPFNAAGKNKS